MRCVCYLLLCLASLNTPAYTEVKFIDVTASARINFKHIDGRSGEKYLVETLGSGVLSSLTLTVDGNLDLYIVNATHIPPPTRTTESLIQSHPFAKKYALSEQ